jgi:hypothetical protein
LTDFENHATLIFELHERAKKEVASVSQRMGGHDFRQYHNPIVGQYDSVLLTNIKDIQQVIPS